MWNKVLCLLSLNSLSKMRRCPVPPHSGVQAPEDTPWRHPWTPKQNQLRADSGPALKSQVRTRVWRCLWWPVPLSAKQRIVYFRRHGSKQIRTREVTMCSSFCAVGSISGHRGANPTAITFLDLLVHRAMRTNASACIWTGISQPFLNLLVIVSRPTLCRNALDPSFRHW